MEYFLPKQYYLQHVVIVSNVSISSVPSSISYSYTGPFCGGALSQIEHSCHPFLLSHWSVCLDLIAILLFMGCPMDQRLMRMLVQDSSPCTDLTDMTTTMWPTKCSLLLLSPASLSVQSLKGSLTGPRLYWNPFTELCFAPVLLLPKSITQVLCPQLCWSICPAWSKKGVSCDEAWKANGEAGTTSLSIVLLLFIIS